MVTATGIFLGFMLNFANGWLPNSFATFKFRDTVLCIGTVSSIALLIVVLYRVLLWNYPVDAVESFYKSTLKMFIIGISIPFFSLVVIVIQKLSQTFF